MDVFIVPVVVDHAAGVVVGCGEGVGVVAQTIKAGLAVQVVDAEIAGGVGKHIVAHGRHIAVEVCAFQTPVVPECFFSNGIHAGRDMYHTQVRIPECIVFNGLQGFGKLYGANVPCILECPFVDGGHAFRDHNSLPSIVLGIFQQCRGAVPVALVQDALFVIPIVLVVAVYLEPVHTTADECVVIHIGHGGRDPDMVVHIHAAEHVMLDPLYAVTNVDPADVGTVIECARTNRLYVTGDIYAIQHKQVGKGIAANAVDVVPDIHAADVAGVVVPRSRVFVGVIRDGNFVVVGGFHGQVSVPFHEPMDVVGTIFVGVDPAFCPEFRCVLVQIILCFKDDGIVHAVPVGVVTGFVQQVLGQGNGSTVVGGGVVSFPCEPTSERTIVLRRCCRYGDGVVDCQDLFVDHRGHAIVVHEFHTVAAVDDHVVTVFAHDVTPPFGSGIVVDANIFVEIVVVAVFVIQREQVALPIVRLVALEVDVGQVVAIAECAVLYAVDTCRNDKLGYVQLCQSPPFDGVQTFRQNDLGQVSGRFKAGSLQQCYAIRYGVRGVRLSPGIPDQCCHILSEQYTVYSRMLRATIRYREGCQLIAFLEGFFTDIPHAGGNVDGGDIVAFVKGIRSDVCYTFCDGHGYKVVVVECPFADSLYVTGNSQFRNLVHILERMIANVCNVRTDHKCGDLSMIGQPGSESAICNRLICFFFVHCVIVPGILPVGNAVATLSVNSISDATHRQRTIGGELPRDIVTYGAAIANGVGRFVDGTEGDIGAVFLVSFFLGSFYCKVYDVFIQRKIRSVVVHLDTTVEPFSIFVYIIVILGEVQHTPMAENIAVFRHHQIRPTFRIFRIRHIVPEVVAKPHIFFALAIPIMFVFTGIHVADVVKLYGILLGFVDGGEHDAVVPAVIEGVVLHIVQRNNILCTIEIHAVLLCPYIVYRIIIRQTEAGKVVTGNVLELRTLVFRQGLEQVTGIGRGFLFVGSFPLPAAQTTVVVRCVFVIVEIILILLSVADVVEQDIVRLSRPLRCRFFCRQRDGAMSLGSLTLCATPTDLGLDTATFSLPIADHIGHAHLGIFFRCHRRERCKRVRISYVTMPSRMNTLKSSVFPPLA